RFNGYGIYIYALRDSDIAKMDSNAHFIGHTVTVTGILRYFADPVHVPIATSIPVPHPPEHFYFDVAEARVIGSKPQRPKDGGSQTHASAPNPSAAATPSAQLPDGVAAKEVHFYSEGVQCYGKIFTPKGFSSESKTPAVALAPDWGGTATSIERYAAHFASRGLVAMVIDYRGWGKSGGFLQTVDEVKTDDRLRFSQMTARVRIRRKRLIPQQQILDIRNALYYLQGEPGVDRERVGVWGAGMAGGHVIVLAAAGPRGEGAAGAGARIKGKDGPEEDYRA